MFPDAAGSGPAFLTAALESHERAARRSGAVVERRLEIAGQEIRLEFAGAALLEPLTRALAHLEGGAGAPPSLTVRIFDTGSTGIALPPFPWPTGGAGKTRVRSRVVPGLEILAHGGSGAVSVLDRERGQALYWVPDAARVPLSERAAPFLLLLGAWLRGEGRALAHAGAVGTPRGGVLLVGPGGSGKSTTSLMCLGAGFSYAGDDYCLLAAGRPILAHGLYGAAKVDADRLALIPGFDPGAGDLDPETGKTLLFPNELFPARIAREMPIRAVLLPRVTGRPETTLARCPAGEALRALAPSTLFQLPGSSGEELSVMARVVGSVPSFRLGVGTDLARIPDAIRALLEEGA